MVWFAKRTEGPPAAAETAGERAALLPNETYRLARRPSRSKLWLLPAITFLLIMSFLTHQCSVWYFGGNFVSEPRRFSTDLEGTDKIRFWMEGNGKLEGSLEILETPSTEPSRLEIDIFTLTWDTDGFKSVQLEDSAAGVALKCERTFQRSFFRRSMPTIKVRAKLHIQVDQVQELSISTRALDVNINLPNAKLTKASFDTISGSVISSALSKSLDTEAQTVEGKISGNFNLYDRLRLVTETGKIDAQISPQEGSDVATSDFRTATGDIKVNFEEPVGSRSFKSTVETDAGNITGKLLLGENLFVKSTSGDIKIHVAATNAAESFFRTENTSGLTKVFMAERTMGKVISYHTAEDRDVEVSYPSNWEGEIHAKVASGDIRLQGKGIEITQEFEGLVRGQEIWAEKGNPSKGRLMARATYGDVILSIGK
ncbi:hypothetical protein TWF694_005657 [Orbilia ellipsospora]|uniref:DUF4097 domain-containing protein n=1 Tax=Orbilia ellipsospora TaxID=2528407 RepID=A0AAV9WRN3_9PEZI